MENLMQPVLNALECRKGPAIVVIDGMCGSGKTTLAEALAARLHLPVVHMDDFFLPFDLRTRERLSQPGGNVHYERFAREVLPFLAQQKVFRYRKFHCSNGVYSWEECPAEKGCIVEGSYSLHPAFQASWQEIQAVTVFLSVAPDEQLKRLEKRNPDLMDAFQSRWIPMETNYFETFRPAEKAHIHLHSLSLEQNL